MTEGFIIANYLLVIDRTAEGNRHQWENSPRQPPFRERDRPRPIFPRSDLRCRRPTAGRGGREHRVSRSGSLEGRESGACFARGENCIPPWTFPPSLLPSVRVRACSLAMETTPSMPWQPSPSPSLPSSFPTLSGVSIAIACFVGGRSARI